jgi:hypothetical protein
MVGSYSEEELRGAWKVLTASDVTSIAGISRSELGRMVRGSPPHEPTRYSDAEQRMAAGLLMLRAEVEALR